MAASAHFYPSTQTRLAGEINNLVAHLKSYEASLGQINAILGQIALDGNAALAEKTGYANADDAVAERDLLASAAAELAASPFTQQLLSRRG